MEKFAPRPAPNPLTPRMIYDYLDQYVIGQERAKRTVAIAAYNHMKRLASKHHAPKGLIRKSNILMIGPTGSGKTWIARKLSEILGVPFTIVDATEYTEAGYYGKDVEVMVAELLHKAGMDVEAAQRGIIFIDEMDKIAKSAPGARTGAGSRDIGGEGVQQSLLKLLEGRDLFVPYNVTQHWNKHDFVKMDTTDILFMAAGTFSDMDVYAKSEIGFGGPKAGSDAVRRPVGVDDLSRYGLIPELLGRFPVLVELNPLSDDDLLSILRDPPDSILREYRELLGMDEVELVLEEPAMRMMVTAVRQRGLGARGFRGLFEEIMHDALFEAPERRGTRYEVTLEMVEAVAARQPKTEKTNRE